MKELEKIKKNFIGLVGKKKLTEIFTDFFELTALAIKSSVCSISTNFPEDIEKNIKRLEKFNIIKEKYTEKEFLKFNEIHTDIVELMDNNLKTKGYIDIFTQLYEELGQASAGLAQFFTPKSVANICGQIVFDTNKMLEMYKENGKVKIYDPTCGAGALLLQAVNAATKKGIPIEAIYVEGQDLSNESCNMCYVQLSLYGIQGIVKQGDVLRNEENDIWVTPILKINEIKEKLNLGD